MFGALLAQGRAIVAPATATGYWEIAANGGLYAFGSAPSLGSPLGLSAASVVGIASTADGKGYWVAAADGGVFSYGDAVFYGSLGGQHLNAAIVGIVATADHRGYYLVARDGGVFTFGDAPFAGSAANLTLSGDGGRRGVLLRGRVLPRITTSFRFETRRSTHRTRHHTRREGLLARRHRWRDIHLRGCRILWIGARSGGGIRVEGCPIAGSRDGRGGACPHVR